MATWLSFWNQETVRRQRQPGTSDPDGPDIWVPWGRGKISPGDTVYCVGIDGGELLLYARVVAERIEVASIDHDTIDVWAGPGQSTFTGGIIVDDFVVDEMTYRTSDGTAQGFKWKDGAVLGTPFQGRASVRELVAGANSLDTLLGL
jgi:hypothetical protein